VGEGTRAQTKIAWIFLKEDGKDSVAPEIAVCGIEIRRTEALEVALGPLPECWISIARLTQTGDKSVGDEINGSTELLNIRWNFCLGERLGTPADISTVLKFGITPIMRWRSSCFNTSSEVTPVLTVVRGKSGPLPLDVPSA
jgi:hypothetical protein